LSSEKDLGRLFSLLFDMLLGSKERVRQEKRKRGEREEVYKVTKAGQGTDRLRKGLDQFPQINNLLGRKEEEGEEKGQQQRNLEKSISVTESSLARAISCSRISRV